MERIRHLVALGLLLAAALAPRGAATAGSIRAAGVAPCSATQPAPPLPPTSVTTIEQAYTCLLMHYPTGSALDDRLLLRGAMVGLVTELLRQGRDQPGAVLPDLHGDHASDWQAFRRAYLAVAARLPDARSRQSLARATLAGLVASLQDDHTQ